LEENQPCTGLCYYNKLVGLNTKENNLLTSPVSANTTVTQRTLLGRQRESGDAPCVGLCYHYKKMGEERAFRNIEKADRHKLEERMRNENRRLKGDSDQPCVGLCYYHRKHGLPYP